MKRNHVRRLDVMFVTLSRFETLRGLSFDLLPDHDPMAIDGSQAKLAQAPGLGAERLDDLRSFRHYVLAVRNLEKSVPW